MHKYIYTRVLYILKEWSSCIIYTINALYMYLKVMWKTITYIYIIYVYTNTFLTYHIFAFNFPLVMEVGEDGERKEFHGRHIWYIIYNHGTVYKMKFRYWSAIPWKRSYVVRNLIYNNEALYGNKDYNIYIHLFIYFIGGALSAEIIT